jgi:hypothetical protein
LLQTPNGSIRVLKRCYEWARCEDHERYDFARGSLKAADDVFLHRAIHQGQRQQKTPPSLVVFCPASAFFLSESAETQNRTGDTAIFSRVLYQLSYLGQMFICKASVILLGDRGIVKQRPSRRVAQTEDFIRGLS